MLRYLQHASRTMDPKSMDGRFVMQRADRERLDKIYEVVEREPAEVSFSDDDRFRRQPVL
jgi:hypothetical protein